MQSANTEAQRNTTSNSAQSGRRKLKNKGDHRKWPTKFTAYKIMMAVRSASLCAPSHANIPAHAVSPRISVHAGPNNQSGGCHDGLARLRYHGPIVVNSPPAPPKRTAHRIKAMVDVCGTLSLCARLARHTIATIFFRLGQRSSDREELVPPLWVSFQNDRK